MSENQPGCSIIGIGSGGTRVATLIQARNPEQTFYVIDVDASLFPSKPHGRYLKLGDFEWPSGEIEKLRTHIDEKMIRGFVAENPGRLDEFIQQVPGNIIVICGLAGVTSSVLVPIVISRAKSANRIVNVFGWLPFRFEGKHRQQRASDLVKECIPLADNVMVQNNNLISLRHYDLHIGELYSFVDQVAAQRIAGYTQIESIYE